MAELEERWKKIGLVERGCKRVSNRGKVWIEGMGKMEERRCEDVLYKEEGFKKGK